MRTTVEITEEQRAELLRIAAQRGMKGFSQVVKEALDEYLIQQANKKKFIDAALVLKGSLSAEDADELEHTSIELRKAWR